jgi:hypothetical protein
LLVGGVQFTLKAVAVTDKLSTVLNTYCLELTVVTESLGNAAPACAGPAANVPAATLGVGAVGAVSAVSDICPDAGIPMVMVMVGPPTVYELGAPVRVMALGVVSVP